MSISYAQAIIEISASGFTASSLFSLVGSVSGIVEGANSQTTYLLNSGVMPDGATSTASIVGSIQDAGGGVTVGRSDVGRLLNSSEFLNEFHKAVKLELFGDANYVLTTQAEFDLLNARKNRLLNGIDGAGAFDPRIPNANSLWDIASAKYVAEAE